MTQKKWPLWDAVYVSNWYGIRVKHIDQSLWYHQGIFFSKFFGFFCKIKLWDLKTQKKSIRYFSFNVNFAFCSIASVPCVICWVFTSNTFSVDWGSPFSYSFPIKFIFYKVSLLRFTVSKSSVFLPYFLLWFAEKTASCYIFVCP